MACLGAYLANGRLLPPAGDDVPNRLIPFAILGSGTLTLDPFREQVNGDPAHYYVEERRSSLVSLYPVGAAIVALPVYVPCYAWLRSRGHDSPAWLFVASKLAGKLAAAIIAAACTALLFLMLRRRVSAAMAAAITLTFALGTGMWVIASQQLWQHGPGVLCILLGMRFLTLPGSPAAGADAAAAPRAGWAAAAAGLALGMAFAVRPQNVFFLAAGGAYLLLRGGDPGRRRRSVLGFVLGSAAPVAATLAYSLYYFGTVLGGYTRFVPHLQPQVAWAGMAGLLLSPNRGLLVFSPAALFGLWGMATALRRWRQELLLASFSAAAVIFALLHASTTTWSGGGSFGPRYLTEALPILALAAGLVVPALPLWGRTAAMLLVLASVLVEIDGAVCYPASSWHARTAAYPEASWDFRHPMLLEDLRTWLARRTSSSPPEPVPLPDSAFKVAWQRVVWRKMDWPAMRWVATGVLEGLHPRERVLALVTLRNAGDRAWPDAAAADPARSGIYAVRLAYRWRRAASGWGPYEKRADLREPLAAGDAAVIWIPVIAPPEPGDYLLQFDLVQERIAWFADKGADQLLLPARVKPP
ncbi:MAG TPA: hypothetical protein VJA16_21410 [Thermoanaerobaculia bacterium]